MRHHLATVLARARAHVHQIVGAAHGVLVVFDHDHRVAEVAQARERGQQAVVVALVQADRGLVEHVHHPGQTRADLARQADALRFAAREGVGGAVEREVVEAHVDQEAEAVGDLAHDALGHLGTRAGELQRGEESAALAERHLANLVQRPPADEHVARLAAQAGAVASGAGAGGAVLRQLLAHRDRVGLAQAALQVGEDALEGMLLEHHAAVVGHVAKGDLRPPRSIEHDLAHARRQILPGRLDVEGVVRREARQHLEIELVAPVPAADRARGQRQLGMDHDACGIEELDLAQPVALRAGARRVVEGEQARLELGEREGAHRAGEARGEQVCATQVHLHRERAPVGVGQRGLEGLRQAAAQIGAHLDAVDHDLDVVAAPLLERGQGVELHHLAVDAHAHETLRAQIGEQVALLALAPGHHRGEDHQLSVLGQCQHVVHHLRHALRLERVLRMVGAVRRAGTRVEQAQVVVDLGDRADGGARVVAGRLLLDRDRRRQALDEVDVGLFHQLQELAGVGRQRLDVAALALGVEGVEGERGLARARQSGDHGQPVARQVEADVPEVVGAGTADADLVHGCEQGKANCPIYAGKPPQGQGGPRSAGRDGRIAVFLEAGSSVCPFPHATP